MSKRQHPLSVLAISCHRAIIRSTAFCEALESRTLLTTYTYTVPMATPPHTAAYLQPTNTAGEVQVRLDNADTGDIVHLFSNLGSDPLDVVQVQSGVHDFLFVDQLVAEQHPPAASR